VHTTAPIYPPIIGRNALAVSQASNQAGRGRLPRRGGRERIEGGLEVAVSAGSCLTQRAWGSYRGTCWSLGAGASGAGCPVLWSSQEH